MRLMYSFEVDIAAHYVGSRLVGGSRGLPIPPCPPGLTVTPPGPTTTGDQGRITNTQLVGASVERLTIGTSRRTHVPEGANDVELEVTIELMNDEITALGKTHAEVDVKIMPGSRTGSLPNWLSPIDEEGDADFPNANQPEGELSGTVRIKLPTVGARRQRPKGSLWHAQHPVPRGQPRSGA